MYARLCVVISLGITFSQANQLSYVPAAQNLPFSKSVEGHGIIYTSGQIGMDKKTKKLGNGFENQFKNAMNSLLAVVEKSNAKGKIAKITIFVTDLKNYEALNKIYKGFFKGGNYPARSVVQVAGLPLGALVEVEAIAVKH